MIYTSVLHIRIQDKMGNLEYLTKMLDWQFKFEVSKNRNNGK